MTWTFPPLLALTLLFQPGSSTNSPAFPVICRGVLPFDQGELEAALLPRRHLLRRPPGRPVVVRAAEGEVVSIEVGSARREVALPGLAHDAAARVVALLIVDLLAEGEAGADRPSPSSSMGGTLGVQLRVPALTSRRTPSLEPSLELGMRIRSRVTAGVSLGYAGLAEGEGAASLRVRVFPLRVGVGYGGAWLDLRLAFVARPYFASGAGQAHGFHWGGGASATIHRWIADHLAVLLGVGVDALATRTTFLVDEQPGLSTSWLVPWIGAGVAWGTRP